MKFHIGDFLFGPLLAVVLTAVGLVILDRPPLGNEETPGKSRGWKAAGYLVPYLIIPAVQPLARRRKHF